MKIRQRKRYQELVEQSESVYSLLTAYLAYVIPFILIQSLDFLFPESRASISVRMYLAEIGILATIYLILQIMYLYYYLAKNTANVEFKYNWFLKNNFIDQDFQRYANKGITLRNYYTTCVHPELASNSNLSTIFGWGNDGVMQFILPEFSGNHYVYLSGKKSPYTNTEQKNIDLHLELVSSDSLDPQNSLENALQITYMFIDTHNNIVVDNNGLFAYTQKLTTEYLTKYNCLDEEFVKPLISEHFPGQDIVMLNYGALGIFTDIPKISIGNNILLMIQLDTPSSDDKNRMFTTTNRVGATTLTKAFADDIFYKLHTSKMNSLEQYALYMYAQAALDKHIFAEIFNSCCEELNLPCNSIPGLDDTVYKLTSLKDFNEILPNKSIIYTINLHTLLAALLRLWVLIKNHFFSKKLRVLIVGAALLLENVIVPVIAGQGLNSPKTIVTAFIIAFLFGMSLIITMVVDSESSKKSHLKAKYNTLYHHLYENDQFNSWKIGSNINLLPARYAFSGWDINNLKITLAKNEGIMADWRQPTPELMVFNTNRLINEINNGTKFRVIGYRDYHDMISLQVDRCTFTNTMLVQNLIHYLRPEDDPKKNKSLDYQAFDAAIADIHKTREYYSNMSSQYLNEMKMVFSHERIVDTTKIPSNSLCLHAVVVTSDKHFLFTKKGSKLDYYSGAFDLSAEEQLNFADFDLDGFRIKNWVERFLEEELGITSANAGASNIANIHIPSIFIEEDALNMAIVAIVELNISRRSLEKILDMWPRKDYEFMYALMKFDEIWSLFKEHQELTYHSTAINRMFFAACYLRRYDIAEEILNRFA